MKAIILLATLLFCIQSKAANQQNHHKREDDTSLSSIEVVVQQLMAQVQSLQAGQAALRTEVTTLTNTVTALSTAVAFTVRFSGDDASHGVPVSNNSPLRFDDIDLNTGNGYDPRTGIFTAPVAGTYAFFLTQMGTGSLGEVYLAITKHGVVLDRVYANGHEDQGSSLVTTHMGAGEQLWVRHAGGTGVRGQWWTVFSGYLLHPDLPGVQ